MLKFLVYALIGTSVAATDPNADRVAKALFVQDSPAQIAKREWNQLKRERFVKARPDKIRRRLQGGDADDTTSVDSILAPAPAALASIPKAKAQYDFGLSPEGGPDRRLGAGFVALQVTNMFGAHANLEFVAEYMDHGDSPSSWDMACPFELLPAQRIHCANVQEFQARTDLNQELPETGSEGLIVYRVHNLTPFVDTTEDVDVAIYWNKDGSGNYNAEGEWVVNEEPTVNAMIGENLASQDLWLLFAQLKGEANPSAEPSGEGFSLRRSGIQVDGVVGNSMLAFDIGPDTQLLEENRQAWEAAYPGLQQLASRVCAKYGHPEGLFMRTDVCKGQWIGSVEEIQMLGIRDETARFNCMRDPKCGGYWLKDQIGYKFSDLDEDTTCDMGACSGLQFASECQVISHFSFEGGDNVYCTDVEYIH